MNWDYSIAPPARRALKRLDRPVASRLLAALDALVESLTKTGTIEKFDVSKLKGKSDNFRLRVDDWRIIFSLEHDRLVVLVLDLGHRSKIYRPKD